MARRSFAIAVLLFSAFFLFACRGDTVSRGNDALRIGDFDRAVVNFSKALDDNPLDRDARYGLALSYYAIAEEKEKLDGQTLPLWERTVAEFRILWNVDSTASIREAYSNSLFYLSRATLSENSRANVLPLLDRSIALDSSNFYSFNLKALIFENLGRTDEASTRRVSPGRFITCLTLATVPTRHSSSTAGSSISASCWATRKTF